MRLSRIRGINNLTLLSLLLFRKGRTSALDVNSKVKWLYRHSHRNVLIHPSFQERSGNFSALYNIQGSTLIRTTLWCSCLWPARTVQEYELERPGKTSVSLFRHCAIANSS